MRKIVFFLHPLIKLKAKKSGKFEYLEAIKDRKPEGGEGINTQRGTVHGY